MNMVPSLIVCIWANYWICRNNKVSYSQWSSHIVYIYTQWSRLYFNKTKRKYAHFIHIHIYNKLTKTTLYLMTILGISRSFLRRISLFSSFNTISYHSKQKKSYHSRSVCHRHSSSIPYWISCYKSSDWRSNRDIPASSYVSLHYSDGVKVLDNDIFLSFLYKHPYSPPRWWSGTLHSLHWSYNYPQKHVQLPQDPYSSEKRCLV